MWQFIRQQYQWAAAYVGFGFLCIHIQCQLSCFFCEEWQVCSGLVQHKLHPSVLLVDDTEKNTTFDKYLGRRPDLLRYLDNKAEQVRLFRLVGIQFDLPCYADLKKYLCISITRTTRSTVLQAYSFSDFLWDPIWIVWNKGLPTTRTWWKGFLHIFCCQNSLGQNEDKANNFTQQHLYDECWFMKEAPLYIYLKLRK